MSQEGLNLQFDDTSIAFANKDDRSLKRAYWLFKLISKPWMAAIGSTLARLAVRMGLPVKGIIRNTIYEQFCGGETLEKSLPTIRHLAESDVLTILDYGVEGKESQADFDHTMEEMLREMDFAKANPNVPCISCKLTGLGRFGLFAKLHAGEALSVEEQAEWGRFNVRFERLCKQAYEMQMGLYIDAEETWIQQPIDDLVEEAMSRYNREQVVIYNTTQHYLKDRVDYLKGAIERAREGNYLFGIKLVRGAYMEKERKRAAEMGYPSPIHETKADTDRAYDEAVSLCVENVERVSVCVATHNETSCRLFAEQVVAKGLDRSHPHLMVCQLLGMSDHITFNMANAGFRAGKYIPYGPVKDVIPYLTRRARENTSVEGQTGRELQLLRKEMQRRKLK